MTLEDELARAVVILDSPAASTEEAFRKLVAPVLEPEARLALLKDLLLRHHRIQPCAFGNGVAFPQTVAYDCAQPVISIIRTRQGVDFGALDGLPVRLFFGCFGPRGLAVTAHISRTLKSQRVRDDLLEQPAPEGFLRVLIDADQRIRSSAQKEA